MFFSVNNSPLLILFFEQIDLQKKKSYFDLSHYLINYFFFIKDILSFFNFLKIYLHFYLKKFMVSK